MRTRFLLFYLFFYTSVFAYQDFGEPGKYVPDTQSFKGKLTDYQVIKSKYLGYDVRYKVYLPPGFEELKDLSVLYLTDGPSYADTAAGDMPRKIEHFIEKGKIRPLIAIFLDSRDPADLSVNRRNSQFFASDKYVDFITRELVKLVDQRYPTSGRREDRALMGLSFGGLNAAYFGIKAYETFGNIGMQSPALHPVPEIYKLYQKSEKAPVRIFLSTGTENDTEKSARALKSILEDKGYEMKYREVPEGHNWRNWNPLIDEALLYFFGYGSG